MTCAGFFWDGPHDVDAWVVSVCLVLPSSSAAYALLLAARVATAVSGCSASILAGRVTGKVGWRLLASGQPSRLVRAAYCAALFLEGGKRHNQKRHLLLTRPAPLLNIALASEHAERVPPDSFGVLGPQPQDGISGPRCVENTAYKQAVNLGLGIDPVPKTRKPAYTPPFKFCPVHSRMRPANL